MKPWRQGKQKIKTRIAKINEQLGQQVFSRSGLDLRGNLEVAIQQINVSQRPGGRPFAKLILNDPTGNAFNLSQSDMENRTDIYIDGDWEQDQSIRHFALRVMDQRRLPDSIARYLIF